MPRYTETNAVSRLTLCLLGKRKKSTAGNSAETRPKRKFWSNLGLLKAYSSCHRMWGCEGENNIILIESVVA